MVDRFERFSIAVFEIFRYWHKIAGDEMKKYGLKGAHATYLTTMQRFKDGISATQLGELCAKDKADVSRMLSIMEKKGLVTRENTGRSLYRALLKLTDEGKAVAEHVQERARVAVESAGKGISEEERAVFYNALETIAANLQALSKEGLPNP